MNKFVFLVALAFCCLSATILNAAPAGGLKITSQGLFRLGMSLGTDNRRLSAIDNDSLYQVVQQSGNALLQVVSLGQPEQPFLRSKLELPAVRVIDLAIGKKEIYLAVENKEGHRSVITVDISDGMKPQIVGKAPIKDVQRLVYLKKRLYVMSDQVIQVYDASASSQLQPLGNVQEPQPGFIDIATAGQWMSVLYRPTGGIAKIITYEPTGDGLQKTAVVTTSQFANQLLTASNFSEQQVIAAGVNPQETPGRLYLDAFAIDFTGRLKEARGLSQFHKTTLMAIQGTTANELRLFMVVREWDWNRQTGKASYQQQLQVFEATKGTWQKIGSIKTALEQPSILQITGRQLQVFGRDELDRSVLEVFDY